MKTLMVHFIWKLKWHSLLTCRKMATLVNISYLHSRLAWCSFTVLAPVCLQFNMLKEDSRLSVNINVLHKK